MPRSPLISKETILQHALRLLIRDGYDALNIKSIAKSIGCSTQPISWHFGSMDGFRDALFEYARNYVIKKLFDNKGNALSDFYQLGCNYLQIACEEPHLFRYLFMNKCERYCTNNLLTFSNDGQNAVLCNALCCEMGLSREDAADYMQHLTVYVHGLASYIATGVLNISFEEASTLLLQAGKTLFAAHEKEYQNEYTDS